jgi:trehalose/maltose hydrolase-like predicted phosphorylase
MLMEYSWKNDELWQIRIKESDFDDFKQPYIGNGIMGCRFDKLIVGTDRTPLYTLSRAVYDCGIQLLLPAWNHICLEIDGIVFKPEYGKHNLEQVLNLRNAVVSMVDNWEYKNGKILVIGIEMFVPRTFGHASYLSFTIKNLTEPANVKFGILGKDQARNFKMEFSRVDDRTLIGDYKTARQERMVSQAIQWKCTGLSVLKINAELDEIVVSAVTNQENVKLELFHAISSHEESSAPHEDVLAKVIRLFELGRAELLNTNSMEWKKLWKSAMAFRNHDFEIEKSLIAHQFYFLCSLEECNYPLGPLGLSKNEWGGNQLWDGDFWAFRAILPLWPDFAKSFINFRKKTIQGARNHAYAAGYQGVWYGWQTDDEGRNITNIRWNDELHINVWIALAAWEYYVFTGDEQFLRNTGWPIIRDIADFFASRAEFERDGYYHINFVVGPDEAVCECGQGRVNDNFLTNYGVKRVMDAACKGAGVLGMEEKDIWKAVMNRIYLLPVEDGIIPEYKGYSGAGIKQADVILAFYPLGYEADKDIILKNIKFYRDKQMYYGPLMSSQIESCILMRLGEKERGLKRLIEGMKEFSKGTHFIPFECRDNDNSVMLTGIGGELQALIYGYYGADLNNTGNIPRMSEYIDEKDPGGC